MFKPLTKDAIAAVTTRAPYLTVAFPTVRNPLADVVVTKATAAVTKVIRGTGNPADEAAATERFGPERPDDTVTKDQSTVTKATGRPPIGEHAMTDAERMRVYRARKRLNLADPT
jgi:hypothetical protein